MNDREERPDPAIGDALRDALGPAPLERVDWAALHAAVLAEVGGRSAGTAPNAWWQFAERWARVVVPLAAAASLASLLVIARSRNGSEATEAAASSRSPSEETALYAAIGDEQAQTSLMDEVLSSAAGDWLFNVRAEN
jgi:hypothetical protein